MDHALYRIFPEFIHRDHIFRILITDGQQIPKFSCYCFPVFQFVSDLDIYLMTLFFSDKINSTIVRFADKHAVTSSFQLQKNNILQYPANHTVAVAHGCVNDGYIAYIKLLTFEIIRYILSGEGVPDIVEGILDHSFQ